MKWLSKELRDRGWSYRELGRRAGLSNSAVTVVMNQKSGAGPNFCASIARALGMPPEEVFRKAGLLPRLDANTEADPIIQQILDRLKHLTPKERGEALSLIDVVYQRKHKGG